MRKLTLIMTASVDGFVVKPDGMAVGASPEPPELKRWKLDRISRAGTHAMGRVTYEHMSNAWPNSSDPYAAPNERHSKGGFLQDAKGRQLA